MQEFTVSLEEDHVNVLERVRRAIPVEITLTQLIQAIVDSSINLTIQGMANPETLNKLSAPDLIQYQGERMMRIFRDSESRA